jgi:hypothetical protein
VVNDAIPLKEDGDEITCVPTVAVQGKHFVVLTGGRNADGLYQIGPAGAGAKVLGVALWDAAVGQRVTVHTIESGHIMPVVAGAAALNPNDSVTSDANGAAVVAAGGARAQGVVMTGVAAGADAEVMLSNHTA